jgi:hypothetical protein
MRKYNLKQTGSCYSNWPKCSECELNIAENNCNRIKNKTICEKCLEKKIPRAESKKDTKSNEKINFIKVRCLEHPSETGIAFDFESFKTFCEECHKQNSKSLFEFDLYKHLKEYFQKVYPQKRKSLCPERRNILIQAFNGKTQDLLDACRWLNQISNSLVCSKNTKKKAEFINIQTFECFHDSNEAENNLLIEINEKNTSKIISEIKSCLKETPSKYINKFFLKNSNFRTGVSLELMILEAKDLKNRQISFQFRCVLCFSKLSVGTKTPIELECRHTICFECFMGDYSECTLDNKPISKNSRYLNSHDQIVPIIPDCHNFHNLYNYQNDIFKLPCFHYSCSSCLESGMCEQCGSGFEKGILTPAENQVIKFCSFYCSKHQSLATTFDPIKVKFYCEECSKKGFLQFKKLPSLKLILDILNLTFTQRKTKCETTFDDSDNPNILFLKHVLYFSVIPYSSRYNLLNNFSEIEGLRKIKEREFQVLSRFKTILPTSPNSTKLWEIEEESTIEVLIKAKVTLVVGGLIIGNRHHTNYLANQISISPYSVNSIKIIDYNRNSVFELTSSIQSLDKENRILFNKSVLIKSGKIYTIQIKLPPGFYFHGRPYDKFTISQIKMFLPDKNRTIVQKNHLIGGPLLGFIVKN